MKHEWYFYTMGMNIEGLLFKAPIENEEEFIEKYFLRKIAEVTKATWCDGQSGLPGGDDYILIYQKNDATIIYCDQYPNSSLLKILDENQGVYFACGETAMAFVFHFFNNGTFKEDSYIFEEEFVQEGNNKLNLTENNDIIHDGLFVLQDEYLGNTNDDDEVNIYKLADFTPPPLSQKRKDAMIEEYFRQLVLCNIYEPTNEIAQRTIHNLIDSFPTEMKNQVENKKALYEFHSKIEEWKSEIEYQGLTELRRTYDTNKSLLDKRLIVKGEDYIKLILNQVALRNKAKNIANSPNYTLWIIVIAIMLVIFFYITNMV